MAVGQIGQDRGLIRRRHDRLYRHRRIRSVLLVDVVKIGPDRLLNISGPLIVIAQVVMLAIWIDKDAERVQRPDLLLSEFVVLEIKTDIPEAPPGGQTIGE